MRHEPRREHVATHQGTQGEQDQHRQQDQYREQDQHRQQDQYREQDQHRQQDQYREQDQYLQPNRRIGAPSQPELGSEEPAHEHDQQQDGEQEHAQDRRRQDVAPSRSRSGRPADRSPPRGRFRRLHRDWPR
jgi:hypothetical protein